MVKRRPAIVISPRLPHRDGLCTVVPLSGTAPARNVDYVVKLDLEAPLPEPFGQRVWWVKCDMIATVTFERLVVTLAATRRESGSMFTHCCLNATWIGLSAAF